MLNVFILSDHNDERAFHILKDVVPQVSSKDGLILWDDGSNLEFFKKVLAIAPKIRIFSVPLFSSFAEYRNRMREVCEKGSWIVTLDHDESVGPNFLSALRQVKKENPEFRAFAFPRANSFWSDEKWVEANRPCDRGYTKEFPLFSAKHLVEEEKYVSLCGLYVWPDWQTRLYVNHPDVFLFRWQHPLLNIEAKQCLVPEAIIYHHKHAVNDWKRMNEAYARIQNNQQKVV